METRFLKTEAIVLNSVHFGEGHKITNLFTQNCGRLEASAFGARKTKSHFGSKLEPFTRAVVLLYRKNEESPLSIRDADVISSNSSIREDLFRFILGSALIEPVIRFVGRAEPDPPLYGLLAASLHHLNEIELSKGMYLLSMYEIKLLSILGYSPDTTLCGKCGSSIERDSVRFMDHFYGFPLCERCKTESSIRLSEGAVRFILWALSNDTGEAKRVIMKEKTLKNVRDVIEYLFLHTFHKKPLSWGQLHALPLQA